MSRPEEEKSAAVPFHAVVDVVEVVLEYADDVRTLRECRGVCRRWALATRRYVTRHFCAVCDADNNSNDVHPAIPPSGVAVAFALSDSYVTSTPLAKRLIEPPNPRDSVPMVVTGAALRRLRSFVISSLFSDLALGIAFNTGECPMMATASSGLLPLIDNVELDFDSSLEMLLRHRGSFRGTFARLTRLQLTRVALPVSVVEQIATALPALRAVEFYYPREFDTKAAARFFALMRDRLEYLGLSLERTPAVVNGAWLSTIGPCPVLHTFSVACTVRSGTTFDALRPEAMPRLVDVQLECSNLDVSGLESLRRHPTLRKLTIVATDTSDGVSPSSMGNGPAALAFYAAGLPRLETLKFFNDDRLSDSDLGRVLAYHGPTLRTFDVSYCGNLGDGTLEAICRSAALLEDLDLSGVSGITDGGLVRTLGQPSSMPSLRRLVLPDYASGACLEPLWASLQRTLRELVLPPRKSGVPRDRPRPAAAMETHLAVLEDIATRCSVFCDEEKLLF